MTGGGGGRWPSHLERGDCGLPVAVGRSECSMELDDFALSPLVGEAPRMGCRMEVDLRGNGGDGPEGGPVRPCSPARPFMEASMLSGGVSLDSRAASCPGAIRMDTGVDVHGTSHGLVSKEASMHLDGTPPVFLFNGGSGTSSLTQAGTANAKINHGPRGPFSSPLGMGPMASRQQDFHAGEYACSDGVRQNAWVGKSLPEGRHMQTESLELLSKVKRPAWNRPVVVPLLSLEELGDVRGGTDRVQLDPEEVVCTMKKFENALVGRLFGKRIPYDYLNSELQKKWQGFGPFRIITISGDCFICMFGTAACRDAVMMGGPWIIAGQVIGIDRWSPEFSPSSKAGIITPVWIRFPGLPMYCWGSKNIARMAGSVGAPLWMDSATDRMDRGLFARVCVRLDLSLALKPGIWVDGPFGSFFQKVEYEGLSSFCFTCGHVGHKTPNCTSGGTNTARNDHQNERVGSVSGAPLPGNEKEAPAMPSNGMLGKQSDPTLQEEPSKEVDIDTSLSDAEKGFGPWMMVQRRKPRQGGARQGATGRMYAHKSFLPSSNIATPDRWQAKNTHPVASWKSNIRQMDVRIEKDLATSVRDGFHAGVKPTDPGPSASAVGRAVAGLGPVLVGGRIRKRKESPTHLVGGDASPLLSQ